MTDRFAEKRVIVKNTTFLFFDFVNNMVELI